jgi:hypothetical protein
VRVVERPLDGDRAALQEVDPGALPRALRGVDPDAAALVATDLVDVRLVVEIVREREQVTAGVTRGAGVVTMSVVACSTTDCGALPWAVPACAT